MKIPKSRAITLMTVIVIVMAYIFAHGYIEEAHLRKICTRSTSGTVTEVIHGSKDNSVIISYKAFGMNYSSKLKTDKKVGEKVSICYNPEDPSQICLKTEANSSKVGIWIVLIPLALLVLMKKLPQRTNDDYSGTNQIKNKYKQKLEELKKDDNFDYGDD